MKKSTSRRWRDVPKEELDADVSRRGKPLPFDGQKANQRKESRKREARKRAKDKLLKGEP